MHQQDTARMTDDDTSDGGEVNSTAATREPKEGYNSEDCPVDDDDDAATTEQFAIQRGGPKKAALNARQQYGVSAVARAQSRKRRSQ